MPEQELLGRYDQVRYEEDDNFPEILLKYRKEINGYQSECDRKVRINGLKFNRSELIVCLNYNLYFADIVHTGNTFTGKGIPATPQETYDNWRTDDRFANAAAVGGIIEFSNRTIFGIRSKKVFGNQGTISISVNGYVDHIDTKDLLVANLFKETKEEMLLYKNEISEISFIGPAQMRGKSCDLIWKIRPGIDYNTWLSRWKEGQADEELAGIVVLEKSQISALFTGNNIDIVLKHAVIPQELRQTIKEKGIRLNPLLLALKTVLF